MFNKDVKVPLHGAELVGTSSSNIFNFVMLLENLDEMHDVFLSNLLYAKFVHDECETDGVPFLLPVAWHEFALCVACFLELFFKEFLHNDAAWGSPYISRCIL